MIWWLMLIVVLVVAFDAVMATNHCDSPAPGRALPWNPDCNRSALWLDLGSWSSRGGTAETIPKEEKIKTTTASASTSERNKGFATSQSRLRKALSSSSLPDASSTLLKMHRQYQQFPPHDTTLYDRLQVPPNATHAALTQAYRRLSRLYHPDKQLHQHREQQQQQEQRKERRNDDKSNRNSHTDIDSEDDEDDDDETDLAIDSAIAQAREQMQQIREAYEVLKDDRTRLLYHRYGLCNSAHAVLLLSRKQHNHPLQANDATTDPTLNELLQLMGYPGKILGIRDHFHWMGPLLMQDHHYHQVIPPLAESVAPSSLWTEQQRVWYLAAHLLETIRPLVEGRISEATLAYAVSEQCDRLKVLPLGAQILRCIGRAYRYTGRKALRRYHLVQKHYHHYSSNHHSPQTQHHHQTSKWSKSSPLLYGLLPVSSLTLDLSDTVRDQWRHARHVLTAALAAGRAVVSEHQLVALQSKHQPVAKSLREEDQHPTSIISTIDETIYDEDILWMLEEQRNDIDSNPTTTAGMESTIIDHVELDRQRIQEQEHRKAQMAVLETLQVEALWKVSKIELDRTIQQACQLLLDGHDNESLFLPSHQAVLQGHDRPHYASDGWVVDVKHGSCSTQSCTSHAVMDPATARIRAAAALTMMGEIMVERSKEGTSWR